MKLTLNIPPEISFNDLELKQESDGTLSFSLEPINQLCKANGIDIAIIINENEDNVAGLLVAWYEIHRVNHGLLNDTAERMIQEVLLEDALGQGFSYSEGHA